MRRAQLWRQIHLRRRTQIDLSRFRGVRIDPRARVAYVAGGSLLGDLDHEAMAAGLRTTAGTVSHKGVGGLRLGGGFGRLARRRELSLDNDLSAALARAIVDGHEADPRRGTMTFFQPAGGATGRIAPEATAFPHRRPQLNMLSRVSWDLRTESAPHRDFVKRYWSTLAPFTDGYHTNEVADEGQQQDDQNDQGNVSWLPNVKRRYDPTYPFRRNANVLPTA